MNKQLFWSLVAGAAIMTSCNKEDIVNTTTTPTGETTSVALEISVSETSDVKSIVSEVGGWTNYKKNQNGLIDILDHRVTVQIFADGNTTNPFTTAVVMLDPASAGDADASETISIPEVDLPSGQSYTAVIWVDFVMEGAADAYATATATGTYVDPTAYDLWYNTANLASVQMLGITDGLVAVDEVSQESRDAYTAIMNFTVAEDGSWTTTTDLSGESSDAISVTAIRPLAKVRILLNDYSTREEWETYLAQATRSLDYTAVTVYDTPTSYNALTGESITTDNTDLTFHTSWAGYNNENSNISWVSADGATFTSSATGNMPVVDGCYVFPAVAGQDNTSNKIGVKMYDNADTDVDFSGEEADASTGDITTNGWEVLSTREFAVIPVVTNKLSTIYGNFITLSHSFSVLIYDLFEGTFSVTEVEENGDSETILALEEKGFVIERDAEGNITKIYNTDALTAEEFDDVIDEIAGLAGLYEETAIILNIGTSVPCTMDFSDIVTEIRTLKIAVAGTSECGTIDITGLNSAAKTEVNLDETSDGVTISESATLELKINQFETTGNLVVDVDGSVELTSDSEGDVDITANAVKIPSSEITGKVTIDAASTATVAKSTITGALTVDADDDVTIYSSSTVTGDATLASATDITLDQANVGGNLAMTADSDATITGTADELVFTPFPSFNQGIPSTVAGTTAINVDGVITLENSEFTGAVTLKNVAGELVSSPSDTNYADIDNCAFNNNVDSYLNVFYSYSGIASSYELTMKGVDTSTALTLTLDGIKDFSDMEGNFDADTYYNGSANESIHYVVISSSLFDYSYDLEGDCSNNFASITVED